MLQILSHVFMASLLLCVQRKVATRDCNDGIVMKMWKSGCQPHFLHSTSEATTWSKFCILFSTYITIFFSHSYHWASSFLLFHLNSLYSTYSTDVLNLLFEIVGFITWLTTMVIVYSLGFNTTKCCIGNKWNES
jgi:hypothetical protein